MPLLSVLLPVRNGEATIRTAASTALRAMARDSELVVFDDSSTDGTLAELSLVTDRRLRVVSGSEPAGVSGALNQLLGATDSAFVGRMDADDACLPWRFRRQLGTLSRGHADAVFTTVLDWHSDRHRVSPNAPIAISSRAFPVHLAMTNPVSHPTMVATRGALVAVGGYRAVPAEDYDLWMRLHLAGHRLQRLALPGLAYRLHDGQVTAGAGWSAQSWANPLVASAFSDLTADVLGERFLRLNVLATSSGLDAAEFDDNLDRYAAAVRVASRRLGSERQFALRVLTRRLGEVRALRERSVSAQT